MTEEALSQAGHTWVTVLTDRTADYSFRPEADSLLLVGPRLLDCCADRAPGRPPLEDNLGGGILIDAARRAMAWWHGGGDPPEAELAVRKLAGEGGTVNPEALKWPRAGD